MNMLSRLKNKTAQGFVIGAAASLLLLSLWFFTPALHGWENVTWSWRVKAFAKPAPTTAQVKTILIDQYSLDWASRELALPWPWPREVYATILEFCRMAGVKAIVFDMLYSEPSSYMVADDVVFGEAIAQAGNYVGAFFLGTQAGQTTEWPPDIPRPSLVVENLEELTRWFPRAALTEPAATFPVPELARPAGLLANVKAVPDADGVFRRAAPLRLFDGSAVPLLGFGGFLMGEGAGPHAMTLEPGGLRVGERRIPLDASGQVLLRFRGRSGTHEAFTAAAILQSGLQLMEGNQPAIDPEELRDTYVFFGPSAPGLKDIQSTPVSGDYPGVEIHATFLDNLLAGDFLRESPAGHVVVTTLLLAIGAAVLLLRSRSVAASLVWVTLFAALPVAAGFILYAAGFWWPVVTQALAVVLSVGVAEMVNYATEGKQKRFIKSAFKQYLSGDVIEQILEDPAQLKLGGEKRELSIFFSDLQGFSAISEKLGPVELTALLNDYLTDMSDIIMEEGGTVDKYEGDAIIAFWNAPMNQTDHAARACRAALRCQRKLAERRKEFFDRTGAELFMRIGIHTGEVVVGNMGSHNRFNYTVLGDAANLASRLEGANKQFGTFLMVSESTWQQARDAGFYAREIGAIMVVGRRQPVHVYEVLGLAGEAAPAGLDAWTKVMLLVRAGNWPQARDMLAAMPDDALAQKYLKQCERLMQGELTGWDGIWRLTEK